jgi:prophage antirepressor-like protein
MDHSCHGCDAPLIFDFKGTFVRVVTREHEPWFVARDVCGALALANVSDALSSLDEDEKAQVSQRLGSTEGLGTYRAQPLVRSTAWRQRA